jgi:hypothetical protein
VDDNYAVAATRLVLVHGSRIERVVFVSGGGNGGEQVGALADELSERHPLLVIAGNEPFEAVTARVLEFVRGESTGR